jgi:hypothetical protein
MALEVVGDSFVPPLWHAARYTGTRLRTNWSKPPAHPLLWPLPKLEAILIALTGDTSEMKFKAF